MPDQLLVIFILVVLFFGRLGEGRVNLEPACSGLELSVSSNKEFCLLAGS